MATPRKRAAKKATAKKATVKKTAAKKTPAAKKWSQAVGETSDAMDLEQGVFEQRSANKIAESLKSSAEHSKRRKAGPFQSAMSMLNFYINRAGETLSAAQRARLESAKDALRRLFGRAAKKAPAAAAKRPKAR